MVEAYESVLLVAYLTEPPPGALKLWGTVFDEEPAGFATPQPGHTNVQGSVGPYAVTLSVQPNRVDINLTAPAQTPPKAPPPPIGDPQKAVEFALACFTKVLPSVKVGRAACVIQGHTAANDGVDAVTVLRKWLPGVPIPEGSTDAWYQFTVPLKSKLNEARIVQQLCRWNCVQMQVLEIQVGGPAPQPKAVASSFATLAYIDVFGRDIEILDEAGASEALKEVSDRALAIITGGLGEIS